MISVRLIRWVGGSPGCPGWPAAGLEAGVQAARTTIGRSAARYASRAVTLHPRSISIPAASTVTTTTAVSAPAASIAAVPATPVGSGSAAVEPRVQGVQCRVEAVEATQIDSRQIERARVQPTCAHVELAG